MISPNSSFAPLQIEVLPANSNTPVLVLDRGAPEFRPVAPGAITRIPRGDMRPASTAPPIQADNLRRSNAPETIRTIDVQATTVRENRRSPSPQARTRTAAPDTASGVDEGSAYGVAGLGFGIVDELRNVPRDEVYQTNAALDFYEFYAGYEVGRAGAAFARDTLQDIRDVRLPRIDVPELRFPNFNLPDINLPRVELPAFRLPRIDLPIVDLPSLHWPDLNPPADELPPNYQNDRDAVDQIRERERDRIADRQNPVPQPPPSAATQLPVLTPQIPEGCFLTVFMATHAVRTFSRSFVFPDDPSQTHGLYQYFKQTDYESTQTPFSPGVGNVQPNLVTYDPYGNRRNWYPDNAGGASYDDEGFATAITEETFPPDSNNQITIYHVIQQGKLTSTSGLRGLEGKVDLTKYGITGLQMNCYGGPGHNFSPPAYEPPPPPPRRPRRPTDMAGCTCAQIASIVQLSLRTLKQTVTVPIVSCEFVGDVWTAVNTPTRMDFFAIDSATATSYAGIYLQMANQAIEACNAKNNTQKLLTVIGVDEFPASLPKSLITKTEGFPGNFIPDANVEIPSLAKLVSWFIEQFDALVGQFEIPIEIKDTDPTTPGDQPAGLKLPNIAESIGEIVVLLLQISIDAQTLVNIATRNLVETGQDKQQNFITYKLLQALTDWVGFKYKDTKAKLPMTFNPGKSQFHELLQDTEIQVVVPEFDEKVGLEADLMRFRKAASILDSAFFKKINPNGDIKAQMFQSIRDALALAQTINKDTDQAWETEIEQIEEGFTDTPGLSNPNLPYGQDYARRPKIRNLTNPNQNNL